MSSFNFLLAIFFFCLSSSVVKSVIKKTPNCGDNMCFCSKTVATCKNVNLTYIPKFPSSITEVIFEGIILNALTADTLKPLEKLQVKRLRLAFCNITKLSDAVFSKLDKLEQLDLTGNIEINQTQLAKSFYSLQRRRNICIILDECNLTDIDVDFFEGLVQSNVSYISMRHNHMKNFSTATFDRLKTLTSLDLSVNWIKEIRNNDSYSNQSNIENLTLADNEFYLFPPWLCNGKEPYFPKLKVLDLSNNFITVPMAEDWHCLKDLVSLNLSRNAFQIIHNDVFSELTSLKYLHLSRMLRKIDIIRPRAFNSSSLIELRFQNNIQVFEPQSDVSADSLFMYLPKLKSLHLGHNNLEHVKGSLVKMLSHLNTLEELNLNSTHLHSVPENLLLHFPKLRHLYLGGNKLEKVPAKALENVTNLTMIDLSVNKITVVNPTDFPVALQKSLKEVNLADNPFSCIKCENQWFRDWLDTAISDGKTIEGWPRLYKCDTPKDKRHTQFADYRPTSDDCVDKIQMLPAYITIGVFMCFVILFGTAGYRGRWYIRYWLIKLRWKFTRQSNDPEQRRLLDHDDVMYDAYVIYHDKDRSFVRHKLLALMEEEFRYKLFIQDREPEQGAKVDIMVESIYKSNHVIAVISKHFLKDEWCEFQLAVSIDRQVELKRDYILLVQLEDIDRRLLSKSWCVLFGKTPTAVWCERKNSIKRKLFEKEIQCHIQNKTYPRQISRDSGMGDEELGIN